MALTDAGADIVLPSCGFVTRAGLWMLRGKPPLQQMVSASKGLMHLGCVGATAAVATVATAWCRTADRLRVMWYCSTLSLTGCGCLGDRCCLTHPSAKRSCAPRLNAFSAQSQAVAPPPARHGRGLPRCTSRTWRCWAA